VVHSACSYPKTVEVTGDARHFLSKEFNNLYFLPNVIRLMKSRRMGRRAHVAYMLDEKYIDHFGRKT
jgi:hypothetical protein